MWNIDFYIETICPLFDYFYWYFFLHLLLLILLFCFSSFAMYARRRLQSDWLALTTKSHLSIFWDCFKKQIYRMFDFFFSSLFFLPLFSFSSLYLCVLYFISNVWMQEFFFCSVSCCCRRLICFYYRFFDARLQMTFICIVLNLMTNYVSL